MKIIITESQYNKAIDQFITFLLEPHEERITNKRPNSIFWAKGGVVIVEIENSKKFFLDINPWERIEEMFGLDYGETESAIEIWLERHYKMEKLNVEVCEFHKWFSLD
jgi:hypothetical protein